MKIPSEEETDERNGGVLLYFYMWIQSLAVTNEF